MCGDDQVIEFLGDASAEPYHQNTCREKSLCMLRNPYRKPTQVGG